ncbi:uncharacterized protein MELLADRAFT_89382 [Melampsora larici-populina 98AG31]|uniref:Uncharacterized protein n=1 Tax=Melampsora larici-populina (strain 98AG31 / pathotype 3-4-7) TaxID=747676 RepID=F4R5Z6_MELLP|nr:uncharacterized protein MELLADRAFT_89382 [Melampsora larici-populina 98AG31]EGG12169.1 hypothetical protein MELLADRAFT_89382 [Melampsora larici-populina 98AG31]
MTSSRSISLHESALSPQEFETYRDFITKFDQFSLPRGGQVRFAEAAEFLRRWFPFETEKEDEIRSFFPQKLQLGQMDQGCVLALLRLLSHLQNRSSLSEPVRGSSLYRDLIFIQTKPLQALSNSNEPSASVSPLSRANSHSSNPFRSADASQQANFLEEPLVCSPPILSARHRSFGSFEPPRPTSPPKRPNKMVQSLSAESINTSTSIQGNAQLEPSIKLSANPFKQTSLSNTSRSISNTHGPPSSSQDLVSPPVPPRPSASLPVRSSSRIAPRSDEDQIITSQSHHTPPLPPPKHHTQHHQAKLVDNSIEENSRPASPSKCSPAQFPKLRINSRVGQSNAAVPISKCFSLPSETANPTRKTISGETSHRPTSGRPGGSSAGADNSVSPFPSRSSGPPPVPSSSTKVRKPSSARQREPSTQTFEGGIQPGSMKESDLPPPLAHKSSLLRSQTLNHHQKSAPPLPPPRKRPESLQIHNPHSVPLDQLASLTTPGKSLEAPRGTLRSLPSRPGDSGSKLLDVPVKTQKMRTVSHDLSHNLPSDSPPELDDESAEAANHRRRSISLHGRRGAVPPTSAGAPTNRTTISHHLKYIKGIELLKADGRELVKDVKEGWESRHGRREERVGLMDKGGDGRGSHLPRVVNKNWLNDHHQKNHWSGSSIDLDEADHLTSHLDETSNPEEGWSRLD